MVLPFERAILVLFGHHEQRIRLAVCRTVRTKVVYIQSLDHSGDGALVMTEQLHPVRHVLRHDRVFGKVVLKNV